MHRATSAWQVSPQERGSPAEGAGVVRGDIYWTWLNSREQKALQKTLQKSSEPHEATTGSSAFGVIPSATSTEISNPPGMGTPHCHRQPCQWLMEQKPNPPNHRSGDIPEQAGSPGILKDAGGELPSLRALCVIQVPPSAGVTQRGV